jgi:AraC-like DNA-binding protein
VVTQVHSVPLVAQPAACLTAVRAPHPRLRGGVFGYGMSRSGSGTAVEHRLLPLAATVLVVDVVTAAAVVTGARGDATTRGPTTWGYTMTVGLTPAGVAGLLGVPMRELAGRTVPLADLLGRGRAGEVERLSAARAEDRFALLDGMLAGWAAAAGARPPERAVTEAWRRLQLVDRPRIGDLVADLGVARRRLERGFREEIGLSPGTVARIARFQRAVHELAGGASLAGAAAASGFADQPHLTRETRAMAGITPGELSAVVEHQSFAAAETRGR